MLNAYAAEHAGLAPIVVVPDQLGAPNRNPMCLDTAIGNSATYLAVDVPNWIRGHLNVMQGAEHWAIGGWSQGGTCSIQLGAAHPDLFSAVLDVSGELGPSIGSADATTDAAFGGDASAYQAALPVSILAASAPYPAGRYGVFAFGELDTEYGPGSAVLEAAARDAGWGETTLIESPGTAHDWYTVRYAVPAGVSRPLRAPGTRERMRMVLRRLGRYPVTIALVLVPVGLTIVDRLVGRSAEVQELFGISPDALSRRDWLSSSPPT